MSAARIIAIVAAAAFVAIVTASLTGGSKPKTCNDLLQESFFTCDLNGNWK